MDAYLWAGLVISVFYVIYESYIWGDYPKLTWSDLIIFVLYIGLWPILAMDLINQSLRRLFK